MSFDQNEYNRRYYAANKARLLEYNKQWRAANPDKQRKYSADYYARHPERARACTEAWQCANPERVRQAGAAWRRANPERAKASYHRYRSACPLMTAEGIREICALSDGVCAYCLQPCKPTIDHVVPVSRGGTNNPVNLVVACGSCNSAKRDRTPLEFMFKLPRLGL